MCYNSIHLLFNNGVYSTPTGNTCFLDIHDCGINCECGRNSIAVESFKNEKAFLWYSIIATIITVILLLLVWVMRSRVSFLAALFRETAHCLGSIPALFLQPIITFFFLVLFFTFWCVSCNG
ncbi:unnamed protein product [Leptidea sinapis]|uniref:Choline transporter-like protein n=1 Tax=Leptidea sinapis TaxID=189913 RepID=A0A5E4Q676_9NEOP|nr:unnamed protein product [Leptidea sinapis]